MTDSTAPVPADFLRRGWSLDKGKLMLTLTNRVRLAVRLQTAWRAAAPQDLTQTWRRFERAVTTIHQARHRLALATCHHLTLILPDLAAELHAALATLAERIEDLRVESAVPDSPGPDLRAWIADLGQLGDEFDDLTVPKRGTTFQVVTDPITLDAVDLGRFTISLDWSQAARTPGAPCFRILARQPRPAAGRADTVHPHVQDHRLCAGDAAEALTIALREGRLADAFLIVHSVLTTYNPRSAYAPLEAWDGTPCSECDRVVVQDERFSCEGCDADLCEECSGSCSVCSATRCGTCLEKCPVCEDACCPGCLCATASDRRVCPSCRETCSGCNAQVAADEIDEATRLCPDCRAAHAEEDETEADSQLSPEEPAPCDATNPAPD